MTQLSHTTPKLKIKQKMTLGQLVPLTLLIGIFFLAINMMGEIQTGV